MEWRSMYFFFFNKAIKYVLGELTLITAGSSKNHLIPSLEKQVCKQGESVNRHLEVTDRKTSSFKKPEYSNFLVLS